jgi:FAD/FMN-containing dehydrogenase
MDDAAIDAFAADLRGQLIRKGDPDYDDARKLYNGMIDKRPALIARTVDAGDVMTAVNFGRETGLDVAIRCGGHNGPGLGSVDDGLVIDLSQMRGVWVDPAHRTAQVAGGCQLGDVDHATHAFGLAAPFGIFSTTGVGGLTLGGGVGNLGRTLGLSIDNLLSADVVLADGSFVTADENGESELFWALRGGGGNFGVVTSFTFRLHPISTVVAGPMLWPIERSTEILTLYRDFLPSAPDELNGWFAFLTVPPAPPFPEELHLQKMCGVLWCYVGSPEQAEAALAPVRATRPALDGVMEMPYPAIQSAFDELYPPGLQWYWKVHLVKEVSDDAVATNVAFGEKLPSIFSTTHMYPVDGAAGRVDDDETAWPNRDAHWVQVIAGIDAEPDGADAIRRWASEYWDALIPYSTGGGYVNMMMVEGEDRVKAIYRNHWDRLARIKGHYDPNNLFHVNQNIAPKT